MDSDIPDFSAPNEAILAHGTATSAANAAATTSPGQAASFKSLDFDD